LDTKFGKAWIDGSCTALDLPLHAVVKM